MTHSSQNTRFSSPAVVPSLAPGILIICVGIVLLLTQNHLLSIEDLWKFWPVGLILAGIAELEKWWRQ